MNLYECVIVSITIICFSSVLIFLIYRATKYASNQKKSKNKTDSGHALWEIHNFPNIKDLYERRK